MGIQNKTLAGVDDVTMNFGVVISELEYATDYERHTILHEFGLAHPAATLAFSGCSLCEVFTCKLIVGKMTEALGRMRPGMVYQRQTRHPVTPMDRLEYFS